MKRVIFCPLEYHHLCETTPSQMTGHLFVHALSSRQQNSSLRRNRCRQVVSTNYLSYGQRPILHWAEHPHSRMLVICTKQSIRLLSEVSLGNRLNFVIRMKLIPNNLPHG